MACPSHGGVEKYVSARRGAAEDRVPTERVIGTLPTAATATMTTMLLLLTWGTRPPWELGEGQGRVLGRGGRNCSQLRELRGRGWRFAHRGPCGRSEGPGLGPGHESSTPGRSTDPHRAGSRPSVCRKPLARLPPASRGRPGLRSPQGCGLHRAVRTQPGVGSGFPVDQWVTSGKSLTYLSPRCLTCGAGMGCCENRPERQAA